MTDAKPLPPVGLVKPTMQTRFSVDADWWENNKQDLTQHLINICKDLDYALEEPSDDDADMFDWINPSTGQVSQVNRFFYHYLSYCGCHDEYLTERLSLVESLFRALMGAGNQPMTAPELAEATGRPAVKILQTLSGRRTYKGIRAV